MAIAGALQPMAPLDCRLLSQDSRVQVQPVSRRQSVDHSSPLLWTYRKSSLSLYFSSGRHRSPSGKLLATSDRARALLMYNSISNSEFPSLSGSSQPQYQNQSQAIWANQRTVQQTPVQRPQQPQNAISSQASQHGQSQQTQDQSQRGNEGMFTGSSHLQGAMDDHRYGNQSGMGSLSTSRQPQTSSADDFPPLGRNGTDEIEVDRRSNLIHNGGFGDFSNSNAFSIPPGQSQARHGLPSGSSSQANNTRSSSVVDRLTSPNGMGFGGT